MDCLLRVIEGPDKGREFPIGPGAHLIGRGNRAELRLSPEDVSWEHAVVTRDGEDYYVENLSALGTWVGDAKVAGRVKLRPRDKVRLTGESVLRLEPIGGGGLLSSRAFLATLLIVMLGLGVAAVFFQGGAGWSSKPDNWDNAYTVLDKWLQRKVTQRRVPPDASDLFRKAWRLEESGDYVSSAPLWTRLQIVLGGVDGQIHALELAGKEPKDRSLNKLLNPQPNYEPTEEESAAALAQFVRRRLEWSTKKAEDSKGLFKPS